MKNPVTDRLSIVAAGTFVSLVASSWLYDMPDDSDLPLSIPGYAFSIWIVIYSLLGLAIAYALFTQHNLKQTHSVPIFAWCTLTMLLWIIWIPLYTFNFEGEPGFIGDIPLLGVAFVVCYFTSHLVRPPIKHTRAIFVAVTEEHFKMMTMALDSQGQKVHTLTEITEKYSFSSPADMASKRSVWAEDNPYMMVSLDEYETLPDSFDSCDAIFIGHEDQFIRPRRPGTKQECADTPWNALIMTDLCQWGTYSHAGMDYILALFPLYYSMCLATGWLAVATGLRICYETTDGTEDTAYWVFLTFVTFLCFAMPWLRKPLAGVAIAWALCCSVIEDPQSETEICLAVGLLSHVIWVVFYIYMRKGSTNPLVSKLNSWSHHAQIPSDMLSILSKRELDGVSSEGEDEDGLEMPEVE